MTRTYQPPVPIHGAADADDYPKFFVWNDWRHNVVKRIESWQVHTDWWEAHGAIRRYYHKVITDTGWLCVVYKDLNDGIWYLAETFD